MSSSNMPTGAPGFAPRRSSYASVVSGMLAGNQYPPILRSGAFAHLSHPDADLGYDSPYHNLSGYSRHDPRTHDMDFMANWGTQGRSGLGGRGGQLPSFSSAFGPLVNGHGYWSLGGGYPDHFFTPSYLKGSRYVQRLEEAHKAKMAAHKDGQSANSSQPGSLSTSASSVNLHTKMAPSHRGMTYDLIEKPPPVDEEVLSPLPTKWNSQDKYGGLEVLSDGHEVKFTGPKSDRERDLEACAIRADHPMPPQCGIYYFEVTIISRKREESSIGIGFSSRNVPLSRLPGWEPESWAYHADDGHSFCCSSSGKHYGPPFNAGDIIGCGINFRTNSAFFTKNGDHLGTAFRDINKERLYPSVGMKKAGEHIRVNFGQDPFVFDIDGMMWASNIFSYPQSPMAGSSGESLPPDGSNNSHGSNAPEAPMLQTTGDSAAQPTRDGRQYVTGSTEQAVEWPVEGREGHRDIPFLLRSSGLGPAPFPGTIPRQAGPQRAGAPSSTLTSSTMEGRFAPTSGRINNATPPHLSVATMPTELHTNHHSPTPSTARASVPLETPRSTYQQRVSRTTMILDAIRQAEQRRPLNARERSLFQTATRAEQALAFMSEAADATSANTNIEALEHPAVVFIDQVWETFEIMRTRNAANEPAQPDRQAASSTPDRGRVGQAQTINAVGPVSANVRATDLFTRGLWPARSGYDQRPAQLDGTPPDGNRIGIGLTGNDSLQRSSNSTRTNGSNGDLASRSLPNARPPVMGLFGRRKIIRTMTDSEKQQEKKQIKQQIEKTSTANLAPPLSETDLIQTLVLQFLSHDGYVETARAFAEEIYEEKKALNLDPNEVVQEPNVKEDEDASHRQRIRKAVLEGDIDKAFKHTNAFYPNVLRDNEHVSFRLKCRKFIEMIRQGAEMQNLPPPNSVKKSNGHGGDWYDDIINHDMDLDDHQSQGSNNWDRMDTEDSSENQTGYHVLLQDTLAYGQLLQAEYKDDPRREVKKALEDAFALMAYQDPLSAKEVAHLLDPAGRVAVAEELNSAILLSLGKSSTAALEKLIQQTTVLLEDLGEGGGPGAFISIDDFVKVNPSTEM